MAKKEVEKIKVSNVRLNLPHLITPKLFDGNDEPIYLATIMVPRENKKDLQKLMSAIKAETKATFPKGKPKKFLMPLKKGSEYAEEHDLDIEDWEDYYVFRAKSQWAPIVVGPNPREKITDESLIYSGTNANVVVVCKGYDNQAKGVAFYLNLVQILKGGDKLFSEPNPEDFFEAEEDFDEGFEGEEETDIDEDFNF